jgi:hypothetical protein
LAANTTGASNVAIGTEALKVSTYGNNVAVGFRAGDSVTTGINNVLIGESAGSNITSSDNNIIIGRNIDAQSATAANQINIGNSFKMDNSGDIVLRPGAEVQNVVTISQARVVSFYSDPGNWCSSWYTGGSTGAQYYSNFRLGNNTQVGSITTNSSSTAYNTTSDYRLKENVDYTWDATTRLKQLKPARFNWIADETNTLQDGFIAHEVENIVPVAVTGEKDAIELAVLYKESDAETETVYYKSSDQEVIDGIKEVGNVKVAATANVGDVRFPEQIAAQVIDESKLVPLLVKAIQELEARITAGGL